MKKLYDFLFPKYARLPLLLVLLMNCFVFWVIPSIQDLLCAQRHDMTLGIDRALPLVPAFIVVYILSYVQWVGTYIYHSHESRELCYRMTNSDLIAKLIVMVIFIIYPTIMTRPEIAELGDGPFAWLTGLIYTMDKPISLFPSIHCLESWMCFRTALMMKKKHYGYISAQLIFTLLVFASVVLVKQHFFVDIPAAILVAEIGLFAYKKWDKTHIFEKIQLPSAH